jgi:arsenate reductase
MRALNELGPKKVLNTSGRRYRELGLKDRIAEMDMQEICELLHSEPDTIKRPFLSVSAKSALCGFNAKDWELNIE